MLVKRADMVPIECVARGYLAGSGWKEYRARRNGVRHSASQRAAGKQPAAGADLHAVHQGADRPRREHFVRAHGIASWASDVARQLRDLTLAIYTRAAAYAESRGIIIADTKFEFGFIDGKLVLGDEVLTPDSSRFWPRDTYKPGQSAELLRQTIRTGLSGSDSLEQAAAGSRAAARSGAEDQ